jgi:hypothetical protein
VILVTKANALIALTTLALIAGKAIPPLLGLHAGR